MIKQTYRVANNRLSPAGKPLPKSLSLTPSAALYEVALGRIVQVQSGGRRRTNKASRP